MNRIIAYFTLGAGPDRVECRLVLFPPTDAINRDALEKKALDGLGAPAWIPLSNAAKGLPSAEVLLRRVAFALSTDRAEDRSSGNVARKPHGLEVQLGDLR